MSNDKVVYLKFKNDNAPIQEAVCYTGCAICHNKTFVIIEDNPVGKYPMVRCACCGADIGRVGWAPD